MSEPTQNPKHIQAQKENKIPYEYLVLSVLESDARVHKGGGDKYGIRNWTIDEILASTYVGAMCRHLFAWCMGEDKDPDSGEPHLSHLRACCAVVLDGDKHGKLIDDRLRAESKDPETGEIKDNVDVEDWTAMQHMERISGVQESEKQFIVYAVLDDGTRTPTVEAHGPFDYEKAVQVARNMSALTNDNIHVSLIELLPPIED